MRASSGSRIVVIVLSLLAFGGVGEAQTFDFATCDPSVTAATACSSSVTRCCRQAAAVASSFLYNGTDKAIVIPMDYCHQATTGSGSSGAPTWCNKKPSGGSGMIQAYGLVYRLLQNGIPVYWIINPSKTPAALGSSDNDNEITTDIDAWILDGSSAHPPGDTSGLTSGASPIKHMTGGFTAPTFAVDGSYSYGKKEFPIRGGAFMISANDRANFNAFVNRQAPYTTWANRSGCGNGGFCYDFTAVNLYEVQQTAYIGWTDFTVGGAGGFSGATGFRANEIPVAATLAFAPPKIARIPDGTPSQAWLGHANLKDASSATCSSTGVFNPVDAVYCAVAETDIQSDKLKTLGFGSLWIDHQALTCGATMTKVREFLTFVSNTFTPGNVIALGSGINVEACANQQLLGLEQATPGLAASTFGTQLPIIARYPQNLMMQWGDADPSFAGGGSGQLYLGWKTFGPANGYNSAFATGANSLHRLVTRDISGGADSLCLSNRSSASCDQPGPYVANANASTGWITSASVDRDDLAAYGRFENDASNGLVYYLPGNPIEGSTNELRMLMNGVLALPLGTIQQVPAVDTEVSRASPVIATIANRQCLVQGTFESLSPPATLTTVSAGSDLPAFEFPYLKGHMRAVDDSSISSTGTAFGAGTTLFDAANNIPTVVASGCGASAFGGSCRTVFTNLSGTGFNLPITLVDEAHAGVLVGPMGIASFTPTDQNTFIDRILAGHNNAGTYVPKLGGVDRSTVAVIDPSPVAGGARPKIAYFGAADGMLHAVCASLIGNCTTLGAELWAFLPRVNLPNLRLNNARIDGSPRAIDVVGDFTTGTGTGTKTFHTILVFQTGSGDATTGGATYPTTPAVYALDITDPFNPVVLFEYTTPSLVPAASHLYELGVGLTVATGTVSVAGINHVVAYAETNNGGTAGAGVVVEPIDLETGTTTTFGWTFGYAYSLRSGSDSAIQPSGIPGGAVGVDKTGGGLITSLVFADLYGNLWEIDPATGISNYLDVTAKPIPLFSFTTDYHAIGAKPAIFSDGSQQYAVIISGGYADPADTSWGTGVQQYLIAVALNYPTSNTVSLDETSGLPYIKNELAFASTNEKGYSQALIVGGQVFFTTDSTDVNSTGYGTGGSTGHVYSMDLTTGATSPTIVVAGGAGSLANDGKSLYSGSSSMVQLATTATSTTGPGVDSITLPKVSRTLWLRTE